MQCGSVLNYAVLLLAGCAFVQFAKWGQAEAAMEAHNSKTRLGTSEVPLVVKFADAKRKDPAPHHVRLQQCPSGVTCICGNGSVWIGGGAVGYKVVRIEGGRFQCAIIQALLRT